MKVRVTKHASMITSDKCFSLLCFTNLLYMCIYIYIYIYIMRSLIIISLFY